MQIPIYNGVYTKGNADYGTSYPVNMIPVPKTVGVADGYLRPAYGLELYGEGPGTDRGGINWNDVGYRVMGTQLVRVLSSGVLVDVGKVGSDSKPVTMDYSVDYLAIASNGNLFYYDGTTLTQVTDPDVGTVIDVVWVDGYFMVTDGTTLAVSDIGDPFSFNPLRYGSSEANPDPVNALLKIRNEVYALNRYTIELFDNVGGTGFPFSRIESAQIEKGVVGTHACTKFMDRLAFVGSDLNESLGIYLGYNSQTRKISTREIDQIISGYTDAELTTVYLEEKIDSGHAHLLCHFPNETLVFDGIASDGDRPPVWFKLRSTLEENPSSSSTYRARYHTRVYGKWLFGDPTSRNYGYLTEDNANHFGNEVRWEFGTTIVYNDSRGGIFHEMELVSLPGRSSGGPSLTVWTQYSVDGRKWSIPRPAHIGGSGHYNARLRWLQNGFMRSGRMQRFFGTSENNLAVSRLEAKIEGLEL